MNKESLRMQVMEEQAMLNLTSVVQPAAVESALAEANRRATVFEEQWRQYPTGHDESPRLAALRSVYLDATYGRVW